MIDAAAGMITTKRDTSMSLRICQVYNRLKPTVLLAKHLKLMGFCPCALLAVMVRL
jgi:hypothetical protein